MIRFVACFAPSSNLGYEREIKASCYSNNMRNYLWLTEISSGLSFQKAANTDLEITSSIYKGNEFVPFVGTGKEIISSWDDFQKENYNLRERNH